VKPSLVLYENANAGNVKAVGDTEICEIFESARSTFCQNAVDIFTDCPGRERAGWLCDSYFTAMSERLFTGDNKIEKLFLENFLIGEALEIEKNMLPMCFPAEHPSGRFIPNWGLWFTIEIFDYYIRTKDREFVDQAKEKVYGVLEFFKAFLNEFGLIENLRGEKRWVFIEWSIANSLEYVQGVNFPTNMIYAYALEKVGELYGDEALKRQSREVKKTIESLSFNGEFFVDNAVRKWGKLVNCKNHVSETCQYYALFTGIECDNTFKNKIVNDFGPKRTNKFPKIGRSNMFIGNYLRLFWLCNIGEYDRVISESVDYFYEMAKTTGTLWEHNKPHASCNHGFASVIAVILLEVLRTYKK
jgi:alpha-L-rhamnosidase